MFRPTHITLTSIPPRFPDIGETLDSLVKQDVKIESIKLYVAKSYRRFPEHSFTLPEVPDGVEIVVLEEDMGPATKVLPAIQDLQGQDVDILFCDDDRLFAPNWARSLMAERKLRPNYALTTASANIEDFGAPKYKSAPKPRAVRSNLFNVPAYRWARLKQMIERRTINVPRHERPHKPRIVKRGYCDIVEGFGGVMIKPSFFDERVYDIPAPYRAVDDIWLSGMLEVMGVQKWGVVMESPKDTYPHADADALHLQTIEGLNRKQANLACIEYFQKEYGVWQD